MLNSVKNALRWVKTANALVLASCAAVFSQSALAGLNDQTSCASSTANSSGHGIQISAATSGAGVACTESNNSVAIGRGSHVDGIHATGAIAIGGNATIASSASRRTERGITLGTDSRVAGNYSIALGASASVGSATENHVNSTAIGYQAATTASYQMMLGVSQELETVVRGAASGELNVNKFVGVEVRNRTSYVFAGLALQDTEIDGLALTADTFTPADTVTPGSNNLSQEEYDAVQAYYAAVRTARDAAPARVLQVNGHGALSALNVDLSSIGNANDTANASGSLYARVRHNADAMGALDTRLTQGLDKNAQGVALSNALASLPKALLPGERLRLGIGVGSFDGKSGTAIGVMGKFGASTLLNAGFSSGGGESSTQVGISWGW